jgi:hypothetical protein
VAGGKIKQIVETQFTSKGANKVAKDTQQIGRAQTRLGQASASAGRQFSAQASGLGGLVAAYAGAAATIFAITAAFQALNQAARAEQTITGVNALANAIGESGPKIIKGLQEITKGQLSIVQTAELANLALSSGFSADQINNLAEISLKASRALGRDLTDSFNRLVRGVTKLEPELLDELGIFTRLDPAVEAYARKLGKTVGSLSNFERRQAFANAVAEEGSEKFRDIDTSAETSAESLEKLSATLSDIGTNVGGFIARALAPLAEALSNPIAAIGAFGILAKTVFGTTFREVGAVLERFEQRIESISDSLVDKLGGGTRAAVAANKVLGASLTDLNLRIARVTSANDREFKSLIAKGRAQQLSFNETKRLNSIIKQEINLLKGQQASLTASGLATKTKRAQVERLKARLAELNGALAATQTRLASTGKLSLTLAGIFRKTASAATFLGRGVLSIFNALTLITTVVSLFTTFGAIFLEAFGWLDPTIKFVSNLIRQLRLLLGLQKEAIAQSKVAAELAKAQEGGIQGLRTRRGGRNTVDISADQLQEGIAGAIAEGATGSADEFALSVIKNLPNALARRIKDPSLKSQLEEIFRETFGAIEGIGPAGLSGIDLFRQETGRTLKTVTQQLKVVGDANSLAFKGAEDLPGLFGKVAASFKDTTQGSLEQQKLAEKFNESQINRLQAQEILVNLQEALNSGAANAEQIEKRRAAIIAKIKNLNDSENEDDRRQVASLQLTLNLLDQEAQAQIAILGERDKILKTFSQQIKASEKLNDLFVLEVKNGQVSARLAKDANDRTRNKNALLIESFNLGKEQLAQERAGVELSKIDKQLAMLARDAQKALLGVFVQTVEAARQLAEQNEKISKQLTRQTQTAKNKLDVVKAEAALEKTRQDAVLANKELDRTKRLLDLEIKLRKVRTDAANAQRKASQDLERDMAGQTFQTAEQQRAMELRFAKDDLAALEEVTKQLRSDIIKRQQIEQKKLQNEIDSLIEQRGSGEGSIRAVFDAREKAEKEALEGQKQLKLDEIELLAERKRGILEEGIQFTKHIDGIAEVLAADIVARKELQEGEDFVKKTIDLIGANTPQGRELAQSQDPAMARRIRVDMERGPAEAEAQRVIQELTDRIKAVDFEKLKASTEAAFGAEEVLADLRRSLAETKELDKANEAILEAQNKLEELGLKTEIELETVNNALQQATTEYSNLATVTAGANDRMKAALKGSQEIIEGGITQGFMDFNQALIEGNLTFKNISQGFRDMLGSMLREIQAMVFQKTIAAPIASGIAGLFSAAGGPVHLAGGGSMKRDRVAAMLEPGEFVIRKEAAKKLGMSKLQELNAGISDDPLARLIAMFGGSKVQQKLTGGSASNNPADRDPGSVGGGGGFSGGEGGGGGGGGAMSDLNPRDRFSVQMALRGTPVATEQNTFDMVDERKGFVGAAKSAVSKRARSLNTGKGFFQAASIAGLNFAFPMGAISKVAGVASLATDIADEMGIEVGPAKTPNEDREGRATGGSIRRMAMGGAVSPRDRVPALLEPGEFVIRRPAAKAIGGAALNQMNATGRPPQISVNLNNQGAPKDVQAAPPKMNGDKIILDIITRDLRNNGAIKKTLRRGK